MPGAGSVGAVLVADPLSLRPLRDGARWVYRSTDFSIGGPRGNTIESELRQAASGAAFVETESTDPDARQTLRVNSDGSIAFATELVLGGDLPTLSIDGIELPKPVRANAQIVVLDRRIENLGGDFDGDGINDGLDVAAWRHVVGNEPVTLPDRTAPVTAVRVDTRIALRLRLSSGKPADRIEARGSTWYAAGIGIVRNTVAATEPGRALDNEDLLLGYDGIVEGWGRVTAPPDAAAPEFFDRGVAQSASGLLAMTGEDVVRLDSRGRVLSRNRFSTAITVPEGARPLVVGGQLRVLGGAIPRYTLHRLNAAGALVSDIPIALTVPDGRPDILSQSELAVVTPEGAAHGWIAWVRQWRTGGAMSESEIVLRRFDAAGGWLGDELRLPLAGILVTGTQVRARQGGLVIAWIELTIDAGLESHEIAIVDAGTNVLVRQTIPDPVQAPRWSPLVDGDSLWMLWDEGPDATAPSPHAVRIGADGLPVGGSDVPALRAAKATPLSTELQVRWPQWVRARDGRWVAAGRGSGEWLPGSGVTSNWVTIAEIDPGPGSPTGALAELRRARIDKATLTAPPYVFADRVLLLTQIDGLIQPTVFWRR